MLMQLIIHTLLQSYIQSLIFIHKLSQHLSQSTQILLGLFLFLVAEGDGFVQCLELVDCLLLGELKLGELGEEGGALGLEGGAVGEEGAGLGW